MEGVRVLRYTPTQPEGTLVHFHGGGFRMGCPEIGAYYATRIAQQNSVEVICVGYTLAPEAPFPTAILEGLNILKGLAEHQPRLPLFLSGESAGGGLAASVAILAAEQGITLTGVILLSPWLDLTLTATSYQTNAATDQLFSYETAKTAAELYLQGHAPDNPYASPLLAEIEEFPPTLISTGNIEVLVDDSRRFAQKLADCGTDIAYHEVTGMAHVAVVRDINATGAEQTAREIEAFIARQLISRTVRSGKADTFRNE
jgi:epsilon-lactone hydrolase